VAERFSPGDQVRASRDDPPHHTRVPRYIRGAVGTVVEHQGDHPLPDDRSRGLRFAAADLFGAGRHHVTVDVWEAHLQPERPSR
jgi:hypothetical protein